MKELLDIDKEARQRLNYHISKKEVAVIIEFRGELDMHTIAVAQEAVDIVISQKHTNIIMDIDGLSYIDSTGLGFFTGTLKKLKEKNGDLKLCNLNAYVRHIFEVIHLDYFIEVYESIEETVDAFKKNINKTINKWEQVIEISPEYIEAYQNLGNAYIISSEYDKAIEQFLKVLDIKPNYIDAHTKLSSCYLNLNDINKALEHIDTALNIDPNSSEVMTLKARILTEKDNVKEAINLYSNILKKHPKYADIHNNLGKAFLKIGDTENAIKSFDNAININPNYKEAHHNIIIAYKDLGQLEKNKEKILAHYNKILELVFNEEEKNIIKKEMKTL